MQVSNFAFGDGLYASSHLPYVEYSSPRDSGFVSRTSVISGSPLQRKLIVAGSASLESSPILRPAAAAHFMTPQPSHRKLVQGPIR